MKKLNQIEELTKYIIIALLAICNAGCSKKTFIQTDKLGTSKYVLYRENFKYTEKTKNSDFKIWGKYHLTDSTIVFEFQDKTKIPYNYLSNNIKRLSVSSNKKQFLISVADKLSKEPVPFVKIAAKNNKGQYIDGTDSDMEGNAVITKSGEIETLEIQFIGYAKQIVDYKNQQRYNLLVELEELKPGGRMSEGCLITFLDVLLEYRIKNKPHFEEFQKSDIIFKKK